MSNIGFDPKGFYEFDLARGAVSTRGGARVIVLSDTVVASLVSAAVETGDLTVLRELGKQIGSQVVASLGGAVFDDSPEQVLAHTSGWLGVLGWGRLGFERWGQALVAVMEGVPALDEDSLGIAALLGGVISSLSKLEVACVPVGGKFLVCNPAIAESVWLWANDGVELGTIVDQLILAEAS
ncbi:MAG: hypothetical protein IPG17_03560 [Sandaracinaceae bacterium]|nr:hypothetical protein [Sandaracinaceae bacterium]